MKYETAAEAFEAVKALALDPNNRLFFIWIVNSAVTHYTDELEKVRLRYILQEKFGQKPDQDKARRRIAENLSCLEIVKTIREWLVLSDAEQSAPAMVKAVLDMHRKPDIDVTKGTDIGLQ